ncbi:MAG: helix-turn-helix domain-containing protein [Amphritea sp.]|nr:helix-turn-helix domain-containing protein [Amphritea sp.]
MSWKNSIEHCGAKWLFNQESGAFTHSPEATLEYLELPSDIGRCFGEIYSLPLGSTLSTFNYIFNEGIAREVQPLMDARKDFDEPTLVIIHSSSGQLIIDDHALNKQYTFSSGSTFFTFTERQNYSIDIDTKEDIHSIKLIISQTLLKGLLGEEATDNLLEKAGLANVPSHNFLDIPPHVSNLLNDCFSNIKEGAVGSIAVQGKVLIYLSSLINVIVENDAVPKNIRNINVAKRLYDEIIAMDGCISSLSYFSDKYGLSTKSLNENFKAVYEKTIWSFILEHRLQRAHALLADSDIAIKNVADRFGYANVSHFTNAFKSKYGYPPGELRRR